MPAGQGGTQPKPQNPAGYQQYGVPQGTITKDQERQIGAPSGYGYDPVSGQYVRTAKSYGQDVKDYNDAAYGPQSALNGLSYAFGGPGSGMGGFGGTSAPKADYGPNPSPYTPPGGVSMGGAPPTISGANNIPRETYGNLQGNVANVVGPNMDAANAAAYAKAKDRAGLEARGALTGLSGAMAGRGISGSGVMGRGIQNTVNQGQQQLGAASREEAINQAALAEQNALASYQGDITQRGQNLTNQQSRNTLDVTQRGQDIGALTAANQGLVTQRGQDVDLIGQQYQGGIAQRGQDIGMLEGNAERNARAQANRFSGNVTMRGQDYQNNQALRGLQVQFNNRSGLPPMPNYRGLGAY